MNLKEVLMMLSEETLKKLGFIAAYEFLFVH